MFVITLNKTVYEYDIHSIDKAFYPEKNIKVITPDTDPAKAADLLSEQDALQGSIAFLDTCVNLKLKKRNINGNGKRNTQRRFLMSLKMHLKGFCTKVFVHTPAKSFLGVT